MATHQETRARKQEAIKFAYDIVRQRGSVRLNDLHAFFGDVWKYPLTFIQEIKRVVPNDIALTSTRKVGTIAVFDPDKVLRLAAIKALPEIVADKPKVETVQGRNRTIKAKRKRLTFRGRYGRRQAIA